MAPVADVVVKDYGPSTCEGKPCRVQVFFRPLGGGLLGLESEPGYFLRFTPGETIGNGSGILKRLVAAQRKGVRAQTTALNEAAKLLINLGVTFP